MTSRAEYINRLRKMADLLEAESGLILPYQIGKNTISFYPHGVEETARTAKIFPSAWKKNDPAASSYDADYYKLTGAWNGASVVILDDRESVCQRVQVGTEKVVIPAVKAEREKVVERPIYEYKCEPLLAKAVA